MKVMISNASTQLAFTSRTIILMCAVCVTNMFILGAIFVRVRWVPCHHGMARPQVAVGGKSFGYGG
jgi:hypothetical protein